MNDTPARNSSDSGEVSEYVKENQEFLARVLEYGNSEARSYALALLLNGGTDNGIEAVQEELNRLQTGGE